MTDTIYVVDLAYPFNSVMGQVDPNKETWGEQVKEWGRYDGLLFNLSEDLGSACSSSGTGMGLRDHQFEFTDDVAATMFAYQVASTFADMEYVTIYEDEEGIGPILQEGEYDDHYDQITQQMRDEAGRYQL